MTDWARLALCPEFAQTRIFVRIPPGSGREVSHPILILRQPLEGAAEPAAGEPLPVTVCTSCRPADSRVFRCACGRVVWVADD